MEATSAVPGGGRGATVSGTGGASPESEGSQDGDALSVLETRLVDHQGVRPFGDGSLSGEEMAQHRLQLQRLRNGPPSTVLELDLVPDVGSAEEDDSDVDEDETASVDTGGSGLREEELRAAATSLEELDAAFHKLLQDPRLDAKPVPARKLRRRARAMDELRAAISGRTNTYALLEPTEEDPHHLNVAPEQDRNQLPLREHSETGHRRLKRAAFLVVEELEKRIVTNAVMRRSYIKLSWYLAALLLLLLVLQFQLKIGDDTEGQIHAVLRDQLFSVETGTKNFQDQIISTLSTKEDILTWFKASLVDSIFTAPTCGDEVCAAPEEYPTFAASESARQFHGCEADCGRATTQRVKVSFFDPWKLQQAYDIVATAEAEGWDFGEGRIQSGRFTRRAPVAGWNICSRTLKEYGFFTTVCIFDGDVFIDGLPYRTVELEDGGASFEGSLELDLFPGDWELRIGFDAFSWTYNQGIGSSREVPIAFPAVRGEVCVEGTNNTGLSCSTWDPCTTGSACKCEWWQDGLYVPGE